MISFVLFVKVGRLELIGEELVKDSKQRRGIISSLISCYSQGFFIFQLKYELMSFDL
jgi:hypothetical protein